MHFDPLPPKLDMVKILGMPFIRQDFPGVNEKVEFANALEIIFSLIF